MVRGEGSRDILDCLLSFQTTSSYLIHDDSERLAAHKEKRLEFQESDNIIGPHQGRVANDSENSIKLTEQTLKD